MEELERDKRKKNLVIFNLGESEVGEPEGRYEEDEKICIVIFRDVLGIGNSKIEKAIRLGKKIMGKKRALLVRLE